MLLSYCIVLYCAVQHCTDGPVEEAEDERECDEGGVPVACCGHGRDAEVHEDDGLSD